MRRETFVEQLLVNYAWLVFTVKPSVASVTDVYISQVSSSTEDCQRKARSRTTGFGRTGFHLDEKK